MAIEEIRNQKNGKRKTKFLYQELEHQLRTQIESGQFKKGQRLPSTSELMAQMDIEYRTVMTSLKLLEKSGHIRLNNGRGSGPLVIWQKPSQRKVNIAFIKWCDNPQFVATSLGIRRFIEEKGVDCQILDARRSHDYVMEMISHQPDNISGLLLYPWDTADYRRVIEKAMQSGLKMTFLDRYIPGIPVASVTPDNYGGAYMATKHLLDTHRAPVYYFGMTGSHSSRVDRFHGWAEAMCEHNYEIEPHLCELKGSEYESSFAKREKIFQMNCQMARELLLSASKSKKRYSVFCYNGNSHKSIYSAAEELGLKIGRDFYVAGFMPVSFGGNLLVPLTRVLQNDEEVGYEGARILYDLITNKLKHPLHRVLPVKMEIRESSTGQRQSIVEFDKQIRPLKREIIKN
jgi:GntR family transcriptional regulator, arabinose operon transcriptional repressor